MKRLLASLLILALTLSMAACSNQDPAGNESGSLELSAPEPTETPGEPETGTADTSRFYIEETLNLANNAGQEWTYDQASDAWVLSVVPAVAYPELPDQQGVSVCVPGAYVSGVDTDGDGSEDVTGESGVQAANGSLVIDYNASVTSTNGQTYTAATAPVILNTGAEGYGSRNNAAASTQYAQEGYINVYCGNRGKQDTAADDSGNTYYTGDAPSCLTDQKAAARYVKYNILLGNLPGSVERFISTGGSGGGGHAVMFAATSNHPDFYDYQIEAGAVGVYQNDDGSYSTTVTVDGQEYDLSDGAWGCIAYSAITPLYEGDIALAFEYYMDTTYEFNTPFQAQLAEYLSEAYMDYINGQGLSVAESAVGFDLNGDGDMEDTVALTIEYDPEEYPETNGYHGSYLDLYLAEFRSNLQWYLDNLDYAEGWTWFDETGVALSDEDVAAMTGEEKAAAFLEGRYAKGGTGGRGGFGGGRGEFNGELGERPEGEFPGGETEGGLPDGGFSPDGDIPEGVFPGGKMGEGLPEGELPEGGFPGKAGGGFDAGGRGMIVGTPDSGTTQAAGSSIDSAGYSTYQEMVEAYAADIAEVESGDRYGNNQVSLYNPLNYIGAEGSESPAWVRIMMGAAEGDMSMFNSLNLQIAMLNTGIDADIQWQWDGGHVPSEIFSSSFALYVDQMVAKHGDGTHVEAPAAAPQTANGTAEAASGTDLSAWVESSDIGNVSFSIADAVAYRTKGASKAIPGFDVIDYGQEDYVFGSTTADARHWSRFLLEAFQEHADVLEPLFNN